MHRLAAGMRAVAEIDLHDAGNAEVQPVAEQQERIRAITDPEGSVREAKKAREEQLEQEHGWISCRHNWRGEHETSMGRISRSMPRAGHPFAYGLERIA